MRLWCYVFLGWASFCFADQCWLDPLHAKPEAEFNPSALLSLNSADEVPAILGDLKNNWVWAYHSHSPQTEDYRVVAFSPKSPYIVAYTGCPKWKLDADGNLVRDKSGYAISVPYPKEAFPLCEQVETMKLSYPSETVELKAYRLPGKLNRSGDLQALLFHQDTPLNAKGIRCIDCHGTEPQPNWSPYNAWLGFFGSRGREGEDVMRLGSKEYRRYVDYVNLIFAEPQSYRRYTGLAWRLGAPTSVQIAHAKYDSEEEKNTVLGRLEYHLKHGEIPVRISHSGTPGPGPELNKMLSVWRGRMIVKKFVTSPQYTQIRYALASIVLGCEKIDPAAFPITEFLPAGFTKESYSELKQEIEQAQEEAHREMKELSNIENPFSNEKAALYRVVGTPGARHDLQIAQLAYLWRAIGRKTSQWNSSDQPFNFSEGRSGTGPILEALLKYFDRCDPMQARFSRLVKTDTFSGVVPLYDPEDASVPESVRFSRLESLKQSCQTLSIKGKMAEPSIDWLVLDQKSGAFTDRFEMRQ